MIIMITQLSTVPRFEKKPVSFKINIHTLTPLSNPSMYNTRSDLSFLECVLQQLISLSDQSEEWHMEKIAINFLNEHNLQICKSRFASIFRNTGICA